MDPPNIEPKECENRGSATDLKAGDIPFSFPYICRMLQALGYYTVLPLLYLISLLPDRLFYGLSNLLYVLVYRVFGYRKKVVLENLRKAFPEKTEAEINNLAGKYYGYLCDMTLETFRTLTLTREGALRRCAITEESVALFNSYAGRGQSIIIVMGHFGNWEWAGNAFSLQAKAQLYVLYHPLKNPYFDRLMLHIRSRFGTRLIDMNDAFRQMLRNKNQVSATAFIADQTPSSGDNAYWTKFLNQDTPVFWGTEIIARKLKYPVVYASVKRAGRGKYRITAEVISDTPEQTLEGEISEWHTRRLEQDIQDLPETWLWSHRRWKHKPPSNKA